MVDTEEKGRTAGEFFNKSNVDIVFSHAATYYTSACVLPVHQINKAPVVILNLQPTPEMAYEITAQIVGWPNAQMFCAEISNAFNRAGIPFRVVKWITWTL